jgi:hypothetical protein
MIQRASGLLTYNPNNPVMVNGPQQYDDTKVGPSFTLPAKPDQYWHWYEGIDSSLDPDGAGANLYNAICFLVSPDGHKFPKIGRLLSPLASPNWENSEVCPNSIVFNPVTRRHHLYYHGGNNSPAGERMIGLFLSDVDDDLSDGGNWTRYVSNPVIGAGGAGTWWEGFISDVRVTRLRSGKWLMYGCGRSGTGVGTIGMFDSDDGITWVDQGIVVNNSALAWENGNIDACGVVYEETTAGQIFHMWYLPRNTSNAVSIGYAWSYDGYRWFKNPTKLPVATGVNVSDVIEAYSDKFARKYRILGGYFDFSGPAIRGKAELWLPRPGEFSTPDRTLTDDLNRANDTAPPPGASWIAPSGQANGLHLIGNALAHPGNATYRAGNAWGTQLAAAGQGSGCWVKIGGSSNTGFSGFTIWIVHQNPATVPTFTAANGWFLEFGVDPTNIVYASLAPIGTAGQWVVNLIRTDWFQTGDIIGVVFDGLTINIEHIRGNRKRILLSRLYTDPRDDTGTAWDIPFPPALIGQPYWIAIDMMGGNEQVWRLDEVYHGVSPATALTSHGRA